MKIGSVLAVVLLTGLAMWAVRLWRVGSGVHFERIERVGGHYYGFGRVRTVRHEWHDEILPVPAGGTTTTFPRQEPE